MSDPTDLHLMPSSEYVDMYRNEDSLWWYRGLRGWTAMWLGRHGGGKGRLLDAGCGTGRNMVHYAQLGYQVEGCDLSEEALDFCRKRGLADVKFGSVTELPYGDGDFDVVSIMDVIQMITEDEQRAAVGEALRVLRPGGLLIVNVCALEWLRGQHDEANGVRTRFTKAGLEALWREGARSLGCGLEVLGCGYRVGLLLPAVAAVKLGKRLLRPMAAEAVSDQGATPGFANGPLSAVMAAENGLLAAGLPMPWGSSAFLVARRG